MIPTVISTTATAIVVAAGITTTGVTVSSTTTTTTTTSSITVVAVISTIISILVTIGLSWIFYPAWNVHGLGHIEYTIETLSLSSSLTEEEEEKDKEVIDKKKKKNDDNNDNDDTSAASDVVVVLSLVIPAYNEEERISIMLQEAYQYLTSKRGIETLDKLLRQRMAAMMTAESQQTTTATTTTKTTTTKSKPTTAVEWIIVNDGSNDETCRVVKETFQQLTTTTKSTTTNATTTKVLPPHQQQQCSIWKIVTLQQNSGKGGAVKTGMNVATGHYRLMVDADGATEFGTGFETVIEPVLLDYHHDHDRQQQQQQRLSSNPSSNSNNHNSHDRSSMVVFGSRAHLQQQQQQPPSQHPQHPSKDEQQQTTSSSDTSGGSSGTHAQRSLIRTLLMYAFHFFVSCLVSTKIQDTQCGFKLFTAQAANQIFTTLHLRRWAFDTEIVLLCDQSNISIVECPVKWQEIDGSKLSTSKLALAWVSITMLRDMICVRACYTLGIWKIHNKNNNKQTY